MTQAPTLSVLAQQRAEDAALCERLHDEFWHTAFGAQERFSAKDWGEMCENAALRIQDLSTALAEACHDRDKAVAELERLREHA